MPQITLMAAKSKIPRRLTGFLTYRPGVVFRRGRENGAHAARSGDSRPEGAESRASCPADAPEAPAGQRRGDDRAPRGHAGPGAKPALRRALGEARRIQDR